VSGKCLPGKASLNLPTSDYQVCRKLAHRPTAGSLYKMQGPWYWKPDSVCTLAVLTIRIPELSSTQDDAGSVRYGSSEAK
jgi:hypothetical protein